MKNKKNLNYLKDDKLNSLEANLKSNMNRYLKKESLVEQEDYLESSIVYENFKLVKGSKSDFENVRIIYGAFKNLSPLEAADRRIWIGLAHTEQGIDYILDRWGLNEGSSIGSFKSRFFGNAMRNSFSRLWWYGYATYDETLENPWELTELVASRHDFAVGLLDRVYSNNKEFVRNFLMALLEWTKEGNEFPNSNKMRQILKEFRRISAITLIDILDINDCKKILKKYL